MKIRASMNGSVGQGLTDCSAITSATFLQDSCRVTLILAVTQSKLECVDCFMPSVAVSYTG